MPDQVAKIQVNLGEVILNDGQVEGSIRREDSKYFEDFVNNSDMNELSEKKRALIRNEPAVHGQKAGNFHRLMPS